MNKKVLELLRDNARLSNKQIAQRLGMTENEAAAAVEDLEKMRAVLAYKAIVNPDIYEEQVVDAIVEVKVRPRRGSGFDDIARRIYSFPEVQSLYLISGGMDFLVFLQARTLKDIGRFISEKLSTLEDVQSTGTHFALKKYKKDGVLLHGADAPERLPVTP